VTVIITQKIFVISINFIKLLLFAQFEKLIIDNVNKGIFTGNSAFGNEYSIELQAFWG